MSYIDEMLKSFNEIPREGRNRTDSGKKAGRGMSDNDVETLLASYETIGRETKKATVDMEMFLASYENIERETKKATVPASGKEADSSKELNAIQDMRRILYFLEKKVRGTLSEADRREIKESREQWEAGMEILCQYAEGKQTE